MRHVIDPVSDRETRPVTAITNRTARRRVADAIEIVFGPDPGLVRLRTAARAVASAIVAVIIVIAIFGATMQLAPAFAAAFMIAVFGNVAVRDDSVSGKAITLALLAVAMTASIGVIGLLAANQWVADAAVLAICVAASLARMAGPRGMAVGMIAFMGAFLGDFLKASPAILPDVLAAGAIAAVVVLVLRCWLMRDDPEMLLRHVRHHLDRRIARILRAVGTLVAKDAKADGERIENEVHRELERLNDAFLVAQNELNDLDGDDEAPADHLSWDRFFALELAAERLLRIAAHHPEQVDRRRACQRIEAIVGALADGRPLPPADPAADSALLRAIDTLARTLDRDQPLAPISEPDTQQAAA